jgi:hypothetical protein
MDFLLSRATYAKKLSRHTSIGAMARAVCSSAPLSGAVPFLEHTGWDQVRVSRLGGLTRPALCFLPAGAQLFVITSEAVDRRSRSSPIPVL